MIHAFLIIAHDSPDLLQRIIDRLEAPNHFVFVHYDKNKQNPHLRIRYGSCLFGKERVRVTHGGFSILHAEFILLRHALNFHENIDYFHLISGHDYPCVSNTEFDDFFEEEAHGRSFMHYDSDEQHEMWKEKIDRRVNVWHLRDIHCNRIITYTLEKMLNFVLSRKFDGELYAGWQWFSWHRSLVEWVLTYCDNHPEFLSRFRYTYCCDEVFFHTLLSHRIDSLNICKTNSLRYIDWFPQRAYKSLPLVLDERDYQSIIDSGCFFCRKVFIAESSVLLEKLDARAKKDNV